MTRRGERIIIAFLILVARLPPWSALLPAALTTSGHVAASGGRFSLTGIWRS